MNPDKRLMFHARFSPEWMSYDVLIRSDTHVCRPVKFELYEPDDGLFVDPTLRFDPDDAQRLLQALWDSGLRPNNGEGTSAQVESIKYHLEDMRKLVFKGK